MASKNLFKSATPGPMFIAGADTKNSEGMDAYLRSEKSQLAQLATTGCLSNTFYVGGERQMEKARELVLKLDPLYVGKTAVYAFEKAYMKDMPAFLVSLLSGMAAEANRQGKKEDHARINAILSKVFPRVMVSGKMIRNYAQMIRSGQAGRKSFGSTAKHLIQAWLASQTDNALFRGAVGDDGMSMADVIKLTHPRPETEARRQMYAYLIGRKYEETKLPEILQQYEAFKRKETEVVPHVDFRYLTSLTLNTADWCKIASQAGWQETRMNLNTYLRHGVFGNPEMVQMVAGKLRDADAIRRARIFPYQLLAAYFYSEPGIPEEVKQALADAADLSQENVPEIEGQVYVAVDTSGSMTFPVTGAKDVERKTATRIECRHAAALFASAILRKNPMAHILPFSSEVHDCKLNPGDGVMKNTQVLSSLPSAGTQCAAPLRRLNDQGAKGDLFIFLSDYESNISKDLKPNQPPSGFGAGYSGNNPTETMRQWEIFRARNPKARMICIDLIPNTTLQLMERDDIVNVGGFSDSVFNFVREVSEGRGKADSWVAAIESIEL